MNKKIRLLVFLGIVFLIINSSEANEEIDLDTKLYSNIAKDEILVFFPTSAWLNEDSTNWMVPIHGWVYEPQDSQIRKSIVVNLLKTTYGIEVNEEGESNFINRVNLLLADNERGKEVVINLAGRHYRLPASDVHGHLDTVLKIPVTDLLHLDEDEIHYDAVLQPEDLRKFKGETRLIEPVGRSVISDIDDTVKLSFVTDRTRLIEATFIKDFTDVEGMAELYKSWYQQGAAFHFVSSSPWQLYTPLIEFLNNSDFPWATMSLKKIRFRDQTIFDIFKEGTQTKPQIIESILSNYPKRMFYLIGDSGEQDAQVYAAIAEKYPRQIEKILIRDIGNMDSLKLEYEEIFSKISTDKWQVFVSPLDINN